MDYPGQLLHQAALYNNEELLTSLLDGEEVENIDGQDRYGRTPVYTAVSNNAEACLLLLLQHGANPSTPAGAQCHNMTPLLSAVCDDKEAIVRILLQFGADLEALDVSGMSALAHAKFQRNQDIIRHLESEQDKRTATTKELANKLAAACQEEDVEKVRALFQEAKYLLSRVLETPPSGDFPPLCIACSKGNMELFEMLVGAGCPALAHVDTGVTPLHLACSHGHTPLIQACLQHFPDLVSAVTTDHQLPIHMAAAGGQYDAVVALLSHPYPESCLQEQQASHFSQSYRAAFDLNAHDAFGMTPIHCASQRGCLSVVKKLLDHCLPSERKPEDNEAGGDSMPVVSDFSSLMDSERGGAGHRRVVDVMAVNRNGLTAVHEALRNRHIDLVEELLDAEPDLRLVETSTQPALSLLEFALTHSDTANLELLLSKGAEDTDNRTLLKAREMGRQEIVDLLLKHKSSADQTHGLNREELCRHYSESLPLDPNRFPSTAVSIMWGGLRFLEALPVDILEGACLLHNPTLPCSVPDVSRTLLLAITRVDISRNNFAEFPRILLELPSLRDLNASFNQMQSFPEMPGVNGQALCNSKLEELDISHNKIENLPEYLFSLPLLTNFMASNNSLSEVPADIWTARKLSIVDLSHNLLTHLPEADVTMPNTPRNSFFAFPSPPGSSLEDSLDSEKLFQGDESFGGDDLVENEVKHVHYWITRVKVDDSGLVPSEGGWGGIRILNLSHNQFEEMPSGLACCCPGLKTLILSTNRIKTVCPISCIPPGLKDLLLDQNKITTMSPWAAPPTYSGCSRGSVHSATPPIMRSSPSAIARESLGSLGASACSHRSHGNLSELTKLNLHKNQLADLVLCTPPADNASDSRSLISTVSMDREEIHRRLIFPNLEELDVSFNVLTSVPPEIGELSEMRGLILRGNRHLKELPSKLGLLKSLWKLDLEGCPLPGTIHDLMRSARFPVKDILGFLLSVHEESTEYNCMNLMIVGVQSIGKTSLLQKLQEACDVKDRNKTWNERVGRKSSKGSKELLSTVGIDINSLVMVRHSHGRLQLRTWDFGGQREYYATHQYFLSPRSLYLVVWDITQGDKGIESLHQWLINIQARAPQAHVIIVGTHLDVLKDPKTKRNYPDGYEKSLMDTIEKKFIKKIEPSRSGLPNIHEPVNVSCKTGDNIRQLVDQIYYTAFKHVRHPRSPSQPLLSQKIPQKYLQLQAVVVELAQERLQQKRDPVLINEQYKLSVLQKLLDKYNKTFRDGEELEQATRFLHDNGVLFHYDDALLSDLYFLDPQWLCDQLAKVVTIPEINRFATRGVMRIRDLEFLFKNSLFNAENLQAYITKLLSKFEVALQFDEDHLLLPSLLPTEAEMHECLQINSDPRIPLLKPDQASVVVTRDKAHGGGGGDGFAAPTEGQTALPQHKQLIVLDIKPTHNVVFSCCRLYFMTYFPSGFWPRLITRIMADSSMYDVTRQLFIIPEHLQQQNQAMNSFARHEPEWRCWQTGIELLLHGFVLLRVREISGASFEKMCDYTQCRLKCSVDSQWVFLDVVGNRVLEISLPTDSLQLMLSSRDGRNLQDLKLTDTKYIYREEGATAQLLVLVVQHIDTLLQDWYPDLGEHRFEQNCEGRYLLTRVVPCPQCLYAEVGRQAAQREDNEDDWYYLPSSQSIQGQSLSVADPVDADGGADRGQQDGQISGSPKSHEGIVYCFLVERCMLNAFEGVNECCPAHQSVSPSHCLDESGATYSFYIAPDVVFSDLRDLLITETDRLDYSSRLGKGSFGLVYSGALVRKNEGPSVPVAVKIFFQSRKKGEEGRMTMEDLHSRLEQASCAYMTARQEVSILQGLQHPRIVALLGLSLHPLSLVLSLAPHGSLEAALRERHARGQLLPLPILRLIILQVSEAVAYLHSKQVIYRDLKSENILVWSLPSVNSPRGPFHVDVRLADYGISRTTLLTGQRGFGGTPPFIAPEILLHAGKDTYTEKVDIFSFGMLLYELVTCMEPLREMANPNTFICQTGRPSITSKIVNMYPKSILDLMTLCWSQTPDQRPSSTAIMTIAQCPQFCHLRDVVSLANQKIMCGCSVVAATSSDSDGGATETDMQGPQVWLSTYLNCRPSIDVLTFDESNCCTSSKSIPVMEDPVTAMAVIKNHVWCATNHGLVRIFSIDPPVLVCHFELLENSTAQILGLHAITHNNVAIPTGSKVMVVYKQPFPPPSQPSRPYVCAIPVSSCSALVDAGSSGLEIWLGHEGGNISVWNVDELKILHSLEHGPRKTIKSHCYSLVAHQLPDSQQPCVFSYIFPGSIIYMWDALSRELMHSLDCSLVAPRSVSSLPTGTSAAKCQITSMNVAGSFFYAGTTNGDIIVANCHNLEAISMFKAHMNREFYVKCILPLSHPSNPNSAPGLVTVGQGYFDFIQDAMKRDSRMPPPVEEPSVADGPWRQNAKDHLSRHTFLLSWTADDWEIC